MINIITTTQAEHLGKEISKTGKANVIFLGKNRDGRRLFPDGEVYVCLEEADELKERKVVLHCGAPDPNSGLVELRTVLGVLKHSKADPVEVFFSYFPYGMQDKVKKQGELNMAEVLMKELIEYYNVQKIYILDPHFGGQEWVKKYPVVDVTALDLLKKKAAQDHPDIIYLAPDAGSQKRTGLEGTEKDRTDSYVVDIKSNEHFKTIVKNKTVGAVDDLLETGGTMDRFYNECMKYGAKEVVALVTHGVLKQGIDKVKNKYSRLYLANSVNRDETNVDVTELILNTVL